MTVGTTSAVVQLSATVDMGEFIAAVGTVVPHAGKEKDGRGMERVRFIIDPGQMRAAIAACCPARAAVAVLPISETTDWEGGRVEADLTSSALQVLAKVFEAVEQGALRLEMRLTDTGGGHWRALSLQATDVSGMIPRRTLRVMALSEWDGQGMRRADAVELVLQACSSLVAGSGDFMIPAECMAPWARTAKRLGGLPVVATADGRMLVRAGGIWDMRSMGFLAVGLAHGTDAAALGAPTAYDGPLLGVLMGLLIDGGPDGEATAERELVASITDWLRHEGGDDSAPSAPSGGEAA